MDVALATANLANHEVERAIGAGCEQPSRVSVLASGGRESVVRNAANQ